MKVLSDVLHNAGILKEQPETYVSGGYTLLVRNNTTGRFQSVPSTDILPSQSGNAGKFLTTNGTVAFWAVIPQDVNIYNSDGTLTGNRTVTMGSYSLSFEKDIKVHGLTIGKGNNSVTTNTALGVNALNVNGAVVPNDDRFKKNTAVGYYSMAANTEGYENTSVGHESMLANTTGYYNVSVGSSSLLSNTTGGFNTSIGTNAMEQNTSGGLNVAVGLKSLRYNTTGGSNSAIGTYAAFENTTGSYNTAIGLEALYYNTTGSRNVALGYNAGGYAGGFVTQNAISNNSIYIGYDVRPAGNNQTNQIVIGYGTVGMGSNTTTIGNASTVTSVIYGRLLLGTTSDSGLYRADITGDARINGVLTVATQLNVNGLAAGGHVFSRINDNGTLLRINNWNYSNANGSVWVNGTEAASSLFSLNSTTQGFLPPRMTSAQRTAISSPADGLIVYQTDGTSGLYVYNGSTWRTLAMV